MRLPALTAKQLVRALKKAGFTEARQRGSHLILLNDEKRRIVSVPVHSKDLKRGLIFGIIKQSGLTVDEFRELL